MKGHLPRRPQLADTALPVGISQVKYAYKLKHDLHKAGAYTACRWVIPFSRQFFASAIGLTPLIPWAWKMAFVKRWLITCYYRPCHMEHLIPQGGPTDMNYTGQELCPMP